MNKTKLTVGIILIFVLGGLAGALAVQLYQRHEFRDAHRRHRTTEERVAFIMKRLDRDLDLSESQTAAIRPIVEANEKAVSEIREQVGPEIRSIIDRAFAEIRQKLDPAQQRELDRIRERMKNLRQQPPPAD